MIKIKYGSVFDEKCDLLILPRSSNGGMTSWVRNEVVKNNLPLPSRNIPFGEILFLNTENKYRNAYFIGYAASVKAKDFSDLDAIEKILDSIINFSTVEKISLINIPALGTGAGGLDLVKVMELYISKFEDCKINVNVFIPDKEIASAYSNMPSKNTNTEDLLIYNPRVFISYSWGSPEVQDWVKNLANILCKNGVNARLDRYHLKPGYDMPQWMTDELIKANKVLLICDNYYSEKANMRKAGVGWETMIVQGDMLREGINNKYIAVSFGDFDESIPIYMKSKLALAKEDIDKDINVLLEHLFELDMAPEVGEIPNWIKERIK